MTAELKKNVINMKTLSQDIDDPIVVNAADANGRTLEIIFTQEAAAQLTPDTKVYLSWYHQQQKIKGYNVFTYVPGDNPKRDPYRWKIFYPQSMLYCGDVLACIEIVDDVSIAASNNFMIHVLEDPNNGEPFVVSDDFSEFKNAVIALATLQDNVETEWDEMREQFQYILQVVDEADSRLDNFDELLAEIQDNVNNLIPHVNDLEERVTVLEDTSSNWNNIVEQAKQEAIIEATQNSQITINESWGGPPDNYSYRFRFYQNGELIENGDIQIPKDRVLTDGILIHPTPENPIIINGETITSGFYIQLDISSGERPSIYIDITDVAEYGNMSWHSLSS